MFLEFLTPFKNFVTKAMESTEKSNVKVGKTPQPSIRQLAINECSAVAGGPQVRNETEV